MDSGGGYDPGLTLRDYLAIDAVLSAVSHHGGFMDGVIENFHSAFGFNPTQVTVGF